MEEQNSADPPSEEPPSDEPEPIQVAEESPNNEEIEQDTEQETRSIPDSESEIKSDQEPEQTLEEDIPSDSDPVAEPGSESQEGEVSEDDFQQELLDFADLDDLAEISEEDLLEMQEAIAENLEQETIEEEPEFRPEINAELEQRMQAELAQKQQRKGKALVTKDQLVEYLAARRTKIVYHALFWLAFESEDHEASKQILYDALKDVTSKDPVESLEEHKFYFGLGFILRLKLLDQKIVQFKAGKLKLTIAIPMFQDMLRIIGDPISERPILTSKEKNKMYTDFLSDDFLDI